MKNMSIEDQKIEEALNSVNFDGDTMPELSWESGTGFYFSGYVNETSLKAFADANGIEITEQAFLEKFIDDAVND